MQLEERLSSAPLGVAFSLTLASASASTLEVLIFMSMLRAAGGQAMQLRGAFPPSFSRCCCCFFHFIVLTSAAKDLGIESTASFAFGSYTCVI